MPPYEVETMTSWADRVELEEQTEGDLPAPTEHFDERKGIKTVTEYKFNEDGKKVKVVRTFKIEKRKVAKTIATRKVWLELSSLPSVCSQLLAKRWCVRP